MASVKSLVIKIWPAEKINANSAMWPVIRPRTVRFVIFAKNTVTNKVKKTNVKLSVNYAKKRDTMPRHAISVTHARNMDTSRVPNQPVHNKNVNYVINLAIWPRSACIVKPAKFMDIEQAINVKKRVIHAKVPVTPQTNVLLGE